MEHGGFDGCGRDELSQIWALDNLDGSHRLGGIESCEQVLSRCMKILREIEASTVSKQVVLISHCDLCHIFQTIFCSLKPGAHRLLPIINAGEVRELKFQTIAGGDDDGEEEEEAQDDGRSLKVFLSSSVGLDRHRDAVIDEAFPRIADACSRRCVAFSYIDLRLAIEDGYGLGEDTVANRLKTLENSNVFVCLIDPEKEALMGVDEKMMDALNRDELWVKVCEELDEGEGGIVQQFQDMHSVLKDTLDALMERESEAEKARLAIERPGMIRREVDKMRVKRKEFARDQLYGSMSGLKAVMDVQEHVREWLEEQKGEEREGQVGEMSKLMIEMSKDFELSKIKDMVRGMLGLVLKKVRLENVQQFKAMIGLLEKKSHAIRKANEKYPWVGRWAECSLLEIEVRYATLSSVPAIKKEQTFYFASEHGKGPKGSVMVGGEEEGRTQTADGSRKGTPGQSQGISRKGTASGHRGSILKSSDGKKSEGSREGTSTTQRGRRMDERRSLLDALGAEDVFPANYNGAAMVVDRVVEEFMHLLDDKFPEDAVPVNLSDEKNLHHDIAKERDELYVPEARLAKAVSAHAQGDSMSLQDMGVYMSNESMFQALIVVGEPGSGKSALLAHTGLHHQKSSKEDLVIMHFAGSCFDASNPVRMMHRFVLEMLGSESPSRLGIKGTDPAYSARLFMRAMEIMHFRFQGKKNVVVLIDSVDKLSESETNIDLWLPHVFPSTVRMVVSTCDGPCFHRLAARQNSPSVRIPTLKPEARAAICASYLARIGRVFSMDQMATAVGAPFTCSPLFLTGLAQQCRLCYSRLLDEDSSPAPVIKELDRSRDVKELYENMLAELDVQYGGTEESGYGELVQTCLTLLWASRKGLQQSELYEAVRQTCPAPFERLLELLMELKQRVVLTQGRLRLFHHQFVLAVERRYLGKYFDDDMTDLMVDGHLLLSRYFQTLPNHYIRKVEEYPYQLCHVVSSYPEEAEELESYILQAEVFREMADTRFHADLCGYWKVVCADKGNDSEIAGKYMGSFQQYVIDTGDKGSIPELCFSVGFLLEDLGQYRSARRVYQEAIRVMQNLSLMHPLILQNLRPNLQAQLFELKPKVLLHLGSSLIKAGLLKEAEATLTECRNLVMRLADYAWARADTHMQMAVLAVEMGDFSTAERLFKVSLQAAESNDLMMQDDILDRLMNLYRSNALIYLQQANHKRALRLLSKEQETLRSAKRMWTQYTYIDPSTSRPPSAIVTLIESAKNAMTSSFTSLTCYLEYDPLIANQPTNLTVKFVWKRAIEEGDDFSLQLKQMRAGGDRQVLAAEGESAGIFDFMWVELTRTLVFVAKKAVAASVPVVFTIPVSERIRLPVKQAGDNRVLATEAVVNVIKSRVRAERARGGDDSRPGTGSTAAASRPGTGAGSRPGSRGGLRGFVIKQEEEEDDDENEKGSPDVARLESRLGEVLGLKTLVLAVKHNQMLGYRDSWIKARHVAQTEDVQWHMRYAYDDNMKQQLLERLDQRQTNEVDGAHITYDRILRVERAVVMEQAERYIQEAIKMQEYLFGDSHPHVTDTVMISVRMYISREKLLPAISLLERVWRSRTGPMTAERLSLGHPREKECSLYHVAITQWLAGNYWTACTLFEALLRGDERSKRDLNRVWSLLTLCHLQGVSFEERLALAGQCVPWLKIVRPLDLTGSRFTSRDVLGRDPGIVPPTTMPPWRAVGQCLKVNKLLRVLNLSRTGLGAGGVEELEKGVRSNRSLCSLNLSNNAIGSAGARHLGEMLRGNGSITELDVSGNNLEDGGLRDVAGGIALGNTCHNTQLRRLNLSDNGISPDGALTLSLALKVRAVRVVNLDLSANPLSDTGVTHVFDALFMGTPFVTVCIADCQFGLPGVVKMAEAVAVSESLKVLDVSNRYKDEVGVYALGNRIDTMGAQVLADAIGNSHSVTTLDVSGNAIGAKGAAALCECLLPANQHDAIPNPEKGFMGVIADWNDRETMRQRGSKGCLRSLKMRDCSLGSEAAQSIGKELGRNPALIGLDLMQSGIGGTGVASVAVALGSNPNYMVGYNTTLTYLNLQGCEAFKSGATHVGSMLKTNLFLQTLVFSDNAIAAEGATAIAEALKENESLTHLKMAKNTIGDRGATALGDALRHNRRLDKLDVSLNSIAEDGATEVARGLSRNATLSVVDFSQNSFGAAGGQYLSVAARSRPVHPVDRGGGALRMIGVMDQDQVRDLLPSSLTIERCQELLLMRTLS